MENLFLYYIQYSRLKFRICFLRVKISTCCPFPYQLAKIQENEALILEPASCLELAEFLLSILGFNEDSLYAQLVFLTFLLSFIQLTVDIALEKTL